MTEPRTLVCAYRGCTVEFVPVNPEHRFHDPVCRTREWKAERGYGPQKPVRTGKRKPSGPQISYRRAVKAMTKFLIDFEPACGEGPDMVERIVGRALAEALPARQRERLEGKQS